MPKHRKKLVYDNLRRDMGNTVKTMRTVWYKNSGRPCAIGGALAVDDLAQVQRCLYLREGKRKVSR